MLSPPPPLPADTAGISLSPPPRSQRGGDFGAEIPNPESQTFSVSQERLPGTRRAGFQRYIFIKVTKKTQKKIKSMGDLYTVGIKRCCTSGTSRSLLRSLAEFRPFSPNKRQKKTQRKGEKKKRKTKKKKKQVPFNSPAWFKNKIK